jgi:hypothetical protein
MVTLNILPEKPGRGETAKECNLHDVSLIPLKFDKERSSGANGKLCAKIYP